MSAPTFGSRLRSLREQRNETLASLAHAVGLAQGTIWRYEQGTQQPNSTVIVRLADHYGVTTDHLLCRGESTSNPAEAAA